MAPSWCLDSMARRLAKPLHVFGAHGIDDWLNEDPSQLEVKIYADERHGLVWCARLGLWGSCNTSYR